MRPAFLLSSDLKPVSALIYKHCEGALKVGTRVELVKPFTTPYGEIPLGTKGFVLSENAETGLVELFMEGSEPALLHWDNILILVPFTTDDLADCLVCGLRKIKEQACDNVTQLRTG